MLRPCLTAVLLGVASVCDPAAADNVSASIVLSPSTDRPTPETAPSGTVVLRGGHASGQNSGDPRPGASGSTGSGPPPIPPAGWDRNYDTSRASRVGADLNNDRSYDTTGFDRTFDHGGLLHP